jgi:Na+-driven multidrug efflux pump
LFFNIALIGGHYFSGTGKYHINTIASFIGLLISVLLFSFMIPQMGMIGAGLATSISYTITSIVVIVFFVRESKQKAWAFIPGPQDFKEFKVILLDLVKKLKV